MTRYTDPPRHLQALQQRLRNHAAGRNELWLFRTIGNIAVTQMLPGGVVKGGMAMRLRAGTDTVRFSADLDIARPAAIGAADFVEVLRVNLAGGWSGFTGTVVERTPSAPPQVPDAYVMRPYAIKLAYRSRSFLTVDLEVGADEIGSISHAATAPVAAGIIDLFEGVGLERPRPVPLLASSYQFAQKLHACTTPNGRGGNDRAHDLVDLQLLHELDPPEPTELAAVGARLFASRRQGTWPPTVAKFDGWDAIYAAAASGLDVRPLPEAIAWVNERIAEASP
jgi:hypothetical protein